MSKGIIHELFSFFVLLLSIAILQFYKVPHDPLLLTGSWIFGTLYLSPDLDARYSRAKNRIGVFKYLFIFAKHRQSMHKPWFWSLIALGCLLAGQGWIGAGIAGAAGTHILLDGC